MDRWRAARCGAGGGTSIPSLRPPRARLIAGTAALLVAVAIAAMSLDTRSGALAFVSGVPGALLVVLLAVTLVIGRPGWLGALLALFALLYLGHVVVAPGSDLLTAGLVGVALLLVGELSQWSFDSRLHGRYELGLHRRRAVGLGGLVLLGSGVVVMMLLIVGLPVPAGLGTIAAGMAAFVALVALISIVALRPAEPRR